MFSKFTSILHQAVEALAPNLSLQEEFTCHWRSITNFFIGNKDQKLSIEHTSIPSHLDRMLSILTEEETTCESGSTGPCMEYMLHHKLLDTLYSLGRTDHPPGMKQAILTFFTRLLSRTTQPLLPHINVYRAVHRLIRVCGEVKAAPSENEEMKFLCTVCAKVKMDPYMVNFFIEASKSNAKSSTTRQDASTQKKHDFSLVNSLLALSHSADGRIAVKSCEGLMLCASLPENSAANCMVTDTGFCANLTERLCQSYKKLPKTINPADLENVQAKWGLDVFPDHDDNRAFPGKRQLISFLSWLDYCDQLIAVANPIIACALSKSIHDEFLTGVLQPSLMQLSEAGDIVATAYLTRCLRTVSSPLLLREFTNFILSDCNAPDATKCDPGASICWRLIDRCNHPSEELCLISLKLFDTLLQMEDENILQKLVLQYLLGRGYHDNSCHDDGNDSAIATDFDNPTSEIISHIDLTEPCRQLTDSPTSPISDSVPNYPNFSPIHRRPEVHNVVNWFLNLLPEDGKSSYQTLDSSYDIYLRDANKQYQEMELICQPIHWPLEPDIIDKVKDEVFSEGPFLKMILEKLSRILDQSYAVNLQLTSVVSKLALVPHPNLHEYILDPFMNAKEGVRTLCSVLQKVVGDIKMRIKMDPETSHKLLNTRRRLMGDSVTLNSIEDDSQLEAVIVLEEFCKELSAIAFVKHHAAITRS